MAKSVPSLLDQIEAGALDGRASLADVLRKCVALGGRAASAELRDWARRELDGYGDGTVELAAYRMVRAAVRIDGADLAKMVRGQQLPRWEIPGAYELGNEGFRRFARLRRRLDDASLA